LAQPGAARNGQATHGFKFINFYPSATVDLRHRWGLAVWVVGLKIGIERMKLTPGAVAVKPVLHFRNRNGILALVGAIHPTGPPA
jgi:hypothetical protein